MKKLRIRLTTVLIGCFWFMFSVSSFAQFPGFKPGPGDTLQSVCLSPDKTVMLQIYAPKASEVTVSGDFLQSYGALKLSKDELGIWSVNLGPLQPDLYSYDFTVDGLKTLDPKNNQVKAGAGAFSNLFEVPGDKADYQSLKNVPHGQLSTVWFYSKTIGKMSRAHIYLPPGYDSMSEKLPVLYLQHGGGDNDASWSTAGRANFILDNLLAEGKMKPMVVVMPFGNPGGGFYSNVSGDADPYYSYFFNDLVPYVESNYKVKTTPEFRAFAGLSMGGLQALNMAFFYADRFAYILPLSTGFFPNQLAEVEKLCADTSVQQKINQLKLFWVAMGGEKDIAYQNGLNTKALFDKYGIHYESDSYPAGHTFLTWRHNLKDFAPLLFN